MNLWMLYKVRMHMTCADPGIFVRGGVQVKLTKKALTTFFFFFFLVLSLFYKSQMVNFKENYHFSRFEGGSTFSRGGGGGGGPIAYDFPWGSRPPVPPSGSALV